MRSSTPSSNAAAAAASPPFAYLRDVFPRLPSATNWQRKNLTPEAWAKSRERTDLGAMA